MSDKGRRAWRFYVEDMVRFSRRVIEYTQGLTQKAFEENSLVRVAASPISSRFLTKSGWKIQKYLGGK